MELEIDVTECLLPNLLKYFLESHLSLTKGRFHRSDSQPFSDEYAVASNPLEVCKDVFYDINVDHGNTKPKQKFADFFQKKMTSKVYTNDKELVALCKSTAMNMEEIFSENRIITWSHPKNVRYIEYYRKVRSLPNGGFIASLVEPKTKPSKGSSEANGRPSLEQSPVADVENGVSAMPNSGKRKRGPKKVKKRRKKNLPT